MTLLNQSEVRDVRGIDINEKNLVRAYIQGAVYCWIKNRENEWFAVRDLVGGVNTDWRNTPLQPLFTRHLRDGMSDDEAFEAAAKDIGWLVKSVLNDDQRVFELNNSGYVNSYRWVEIS